jgi:hypothetical protein
MTEGIIDTADGVFLVRDIGASYEDQRAASAATRIPNSRAGRMLGAAGGVLQVRCGHQRSRPRYGWRSTTRRHTADRTGSGPSR